jgi:hypothetical protein
LNPAWTAAIACFRDELVTSTLGPRSELAESEWALLNEKIADQQAWYAEKPQGSVEKLGEKRLRELTRPKVKAAIAALMAKDRALEPELKAIASLTHHGRPAFRQRPGLL